MTKKSFSFFGFVLMEILPPIRHPTTATGATGDAQLGLKSPLSVCPMKPDPAVAATIADDIPTTMRIGMPHARSMSGILNEPAEI